MRLVISPLPLVDIAARKIASAIAVLLVRLKVAVVHLTTGKEVFASALAA